MSDEIVSARAEATDEQTAKRPATKTRVTLHRAFKFRLYPTEAQIAELAEWERQLRWLYNLAHEQRLLAMLRPREGRPKVDYFSQGREMTEILRSSQGDQLGRVVCSARQEVLRDLDKAWQRWRKRLGGRPHFKKRIDSVRIYFSTPKHWKMEWNALRLGGVASSVGPIKIRQDRPWPEDAKFTSCHIVRDVEEWYAAFPLEYTAEQQKPKGHMVAINRGAVHAVADSFGKMVDSPSYYTQQLGRIAKLSRDLKRKESGGRNREKARIRLAKKHQKIRRQREWFLHHISSQYARDYKIIVMEDWSTREMTKKNYGPDPGNTVASDSGLIAVQQPSRKNLLNRKILDVGWYELARQLGYKVEVTGGELRLVACGLGDEKQDGGISTTCNGCGAGIPYASGKLEAVCGNCGCVQEGDVNAAKNLLLRGMLNTSTTKPVKEKTKIAVKGRQKRVA